VKEDTLFIWRHIAKENIFCKTDVVDSEVRKVMNSYFNRCPLCEYFKKFQGDCAGCPLINCMDDESFYTDWRHGDFSAAKKIVECVEQW